MILNKKQLIELQEASQPLIKFLKRFHSDIKIIVDSDSAEFLERKVRVKEYIESPGNCMSCHEPITSENDGFKVGGNMWRCHDCHHIEFGYNLADGELYFASQL